MIENSDGIEIRNEIALYRSEYADKKHGKTSMKSRFFFPLTESPLH